MKYCNSDRRMKTKRPSLCFKLQCQNKLSYTGGSLLFSTQGVNDMYGANVTGRTSYYPSLARGSFIDLLTGIPPGVVLRFFVYIHPFNITFLDAQSRFIRLQIWREYDVLSKQYRLVHQQRLNVNVTGALYIVRLLTLCCVHVQLSQIVIVSVNGTFNVVS